MSKISITPNASGTGVFTISSPATNTDRTLTLPDEAGTVLTSASSLASANLTGAVTVSGGNVGIGTVPTANNISKSISLVNGGSIFGYGNGTYITANSNYNGAWNTVATGPDSRMLLDGNVIFNRSASASAGTAGAVTESMRIDSSGNVGIGTASPATTLDVTKSSCGNWIANFQNTTAATSYGVNIAEPSGAAGGYPLFRVGESYAPYTDYLRVNTGGGVVAGGGIYIGGTAAANLLDDYEEGTWTPTLTGSGSWTINDAKYTKVGRLVVCTFHVKVTSTVSPNDFAGLPFTPNSESGGILGYQNSISGVVSAYVQAANVWNFRQGSTQVGLANESTARGVLTYATNL